MIGDARGQASVELVACALVLALAAIAVLELLAIARTRVAAERVADQAAVLIAEGRPLPAELRRAARIERHGDRLPVSQPLPVQLPAGPSRASVSVELPR